VRGEHDGGTGRGVALQDAPDRLGRHRVDALERLVKEQHFGVVQQRGREADLLAHAGRVVDDQLVLGAGQVEHVQQLRGPLVHLGPGQSAQPARVGEQLPPRQPLEQPQPLGQHPDPGLHLDRIAPHVVPDHLDRPLVRPEQPGDHGERGGLPGPVRPDEPDELARGQLQIDPAHGHLLPEPLPKPLHAHGT
jgi:hypothetical protein